MSVLVTTHIGHADALRRVPFKAGHHDVLVNGLWDKLITLEMTPFLHKVNDVMCASNVVVRNTAVPAVG